MCLYIVALLVLAAAVFCLWQNNSIVVSTHTYQNPNLPAAFDSYRIVHISDLHNKRFGAGQSRLLSVVEGLSPDLILITGDLIDSRRFDLETAMLFVRGAAEFAPIYYVSGNHEARTGQYEAITAALSQAGVFVLDDRRTELWRDGQSIALLGLADPALPAQQRPNGRENGGFFSNLEQLASADDSVRILLSHRPELLELYCQYQMDLVFSGHAHGGQIRLPLLGPLISPGQGLFPRYTTGSYQQEDTTLFVSRGLGNSLFPLRVFNRPEVVLVELQH